MRLIAADVLCKVIKEGQSLTGALDFAFQGIENKQDRAFIQALCYGVMRKYHRLDFILQQLLSKPLRNKDTDIKVLLLIGLYQLGFMRVKPHVAVSETVVAARKKSWAKSLINAVLRQYCRDRENIEIKADQNRIAYYSHPQWLNNIIESNWPEQAKALLLNNNRQAPMALRVNLAQGSRTDYLLLLGEYSIAAKAIPFSATAIVLEQPVAVEKLPGFSDGLVSVQDTAAQLAAELLDVQAGQSVLDMCAAPGGKTAAILETQNQSVSLLALDVDLDRLNRVSENLQRLKLQAKVVVGDAMKPDAWSQGQCFDRVLLDAPCSALGVIRRHPDIKFLRRESDIFTLQMIQQKMLNAAWDLLVSGGVLLYATCSILKQENEQQIEFFMDRHADAEELVIMSEWGVKRKFGRQILTGEADMDGFYYARMVKH